MRLGSVQTAQRIAWHGGKLLRAGVFFRLGQVVGSGAGGDTAAVAIVKKTGQSPAAEANHQRGGDECGE